MSPNQNAAISKPPVPRAKFGKTFPGPVLSGAVSLARIVAIDPNTWAAMSVNVIWNLVIVCRRIIPNPTPCSASKTPSQSQRQRPSRAEPTADPAQERYCPAADVPHSIWHHLGAPRPIAKTGRIQECDLDRRDKTRRKTTHTPTKKKSTSKAIAQAGACCVVQRYRQLRP